MYKTLFSRVFQFIGIQSVSATNKNLNELRLNRDRHQYNSLIIKQLNPKLTLNYKSGSRDVEELVAEMGAAYLCYMTGIQNNTTIDNSAAYIKSWISKFKEDKKMLLTASSMAQKAVDYILEHQGKPSGTSVQQTGKESISVSFSF